MLLPDWLRWLWVAVFVGVVAIHCSHAVAIRGQRRAWHAGHVVMGLGMAAMVAPGWVATGPAAAWKGVFLGGTAVVFGWLVRAWTERRPVSPLWIGSLFDMAAMAYMLGTSTVSLPPLTWAFVVYFALLALAWLTGVFDERMPPVATDPHPTTDPAGAALTGAIPARQRVSLAVMAMGMAYMFVAMQVGS